MNDRRDRESLLNDILAEEAPPGFREDLLGGTLRLVRRRRRARRARQAALVLAVVAGVCLAVWRPRTPTVLPPAPARPYALVRTQPVAAGAWLESKPFSPAGVVASAATAQVVTTAVAGYRSRAIDDDELLDLAAPNPVVLVRRGPHEAELVSANPPAPGERLGN